MSNQASSLEGKTLAGRYVLEKPVGGGGMGDVYPAFDTQLQRKVAIKIFKFGTSKNWKREIRAIVSLDHRNIVKIYDADSADEINYIAMQWLPGGALDVTKRRTLPEVADIIKQLADALYYAHNKNIIHRDVKHGNVMIGEQGQPVLIDFSIATGEGVDATRTNIGASIGTYTHMSPEQCQGEVLTPATDQYSLGILAYNLVTGELPFNPPAPTPMAYMYMHITAQPPVPWNVPEGISRVLLRALAKNPTDRFPTILDFSNALEKAIAEPGSKPLTPPIVVGPTSNDATFVPGVNAPMMPPISDGATMPPRVMPAPSTPPAASGAWGGYAPPPGTASVPLQTAPPIPAQPGNRINPLLIGLGLAAVAIIALLAGVVIALIVRPNSSTQIIIASTNQVSIAPTSAPATPTTVIATTAAPTTTTLPPTTAAPATTVAAAVIPATSPATAAPTTEVATALPTTAAPPATASAAPITAEVATTVATSPALITTESASATASKATATEPPTLTPAATPSVSAQPTAAATMDLEGTLTGLALGSATAIIQLTMTASAGAPTDTVAAATSEPTIAAAASVEVTIDEAGTLDAVVRGTATSSAAQTRTAAVLVVPITATLRPTLTPTPLRTPTARGSLGPPGGGLGKIAFQSDRGGNTQVYIANADGSNPRNLTKNRGYDGSPELSPDGTKIAFQSSRDGNVEIYVMNADGSNQRNLTKNKADDLLPVWSPDGTKIMFVSARGGRPQIYIMNADGSNVHKISTSNAFEYSSSWSPDGRQILFQSDRDGHSDIYVMDADGANEQRLTQGAGNNLVPVWSPDGTKIAFESTRDGHSEIYVMDADGSNQKRLTTGNANNYGPAWSPDGTKIAFDSDRDGNLQVYIMNADGSNPTNFTKTRSSDGRYGISWR